jgi:hypothetical protein
MHKVSACNPVGQTANCNHATALSVYIAPHLVEISKSTKTSLLNFGYSSGYLPKYTKI